MEEKETIRPIEITWEELQTRDLDRYILVDIRGDEAVNYGMIPGAIAIPECELVDKLAAAAGTPGYGTGIPLQPETGQRPFPGSGGVHPAHRRPGRDRKRG